MPDELRDRIARVLHGADDYDDPLRPDQCERCREVLREADAVLAVLPAPTAAPDEVESHRRVYLERHGGAPRGRPLPSRHHLGRRAGVREVGVPAQGPDVPPRRRIHRGGAMTEPRRRYYFYPEPDENGVSVGIDITDYITMPTRCRWSLGIDRCELAEVHDGAHKTTWGGGVTVVFESDEWGAHGPSTTRSSDEETTR